MTVEAPAFAPTPFSKDNGDGPSSIKVSRAGFVQLRIFPVVDTEAGPRADYAVRRNARLYADNIGLIATTPEDEALELKWRVRNPASQGDAGEAVVGRLVMFPSNAGDGTVDMTIDDGTGEALTANIAPHQLFVMKHIMYSALPHITGLGSIFSPPSMGSGSAGFHIA